MPGQTKKETPYRLENICEDCPRKFAFGCQSWKGGYTEAKNITLLLDECVGSHGPRLESVHQTNL